MARAVMEERFDYKGYPCVVLFMPMGFRNGYVGLPKGHKYYGVNYDEIPISCHLGLTYSDYSLSMQDDKNTYWIGFDCGHCCDGYDLEKLDEYFGEEPSVTNEIMRDWRRKTNEQHEFRTLDYVKAECMKIVDQLESEG